jgi:hypothetical protein
MMETRAFWTDQSYDREHAAGGLGLYTESVHSHPEQFEGLWGDIAPVAFACAAWRVAAPPIMVPGFVRCHRRIVHAVCEPNGWDGTLTAHVQVASPLPAELTVSRDWWHDRGWREWPQVFGQFVEPGDQDFAKAPYARAYLQIDVPVPFADLPPTPKDPDDGVAETAHRAVAVLVGELNTLLVPLIDRLK